MNRFPSSISYLYHGVYPYHVSYSIQCSVPRPSCKLEMSNGPRDLRFGLFGCVWQQPRHVRTLSQPPHRFIPWEPAFHDDPVLHSSVQPVSTIPLVWNEAGAPDVNCGEISRGSATHHENLRIVTQLLTLPFISNLRVGRYPQKAQDHFDDDQR